VDRRFDASPDNRPGPPRPDPEPLAPSGGTVLHQSGRQGPPEPEPLAAVGRRRRVKQNKLVGSGVLKEFRSNHYTQT
jgi:hypothetical protein